MGVKKRLAYMQAVGTPNDATFTEWLEKHVSYHIMSAVSSQGASAKEQICMMSGMIRKLDWKLLKGLDVCLHLLKAHFNAERLHTATIS